MTPLKRHFPVSGRTVRTYWGAWAAILALAMLWRFSGITDREAWFDESCTFYSATHFFDWPADGPDPALELAHRPYYGALSIWSSVWGESIESLRCFSAVCGSVAVMLVGFLAWRLGGTGTGLAAGLLAAVHPLHVYYSQEARVYSAWTVAIAGCLIFLVEASRRLQARWWIGYVAVAFVATLTHYGTLFWLPATIGVVLVSGNRRRCLRQWLVANTALTILLLPVILIWVLPLSEGGPRPWLRETWLGYPPVMAIPRSLWSLLPSGGYPSYLAHLSAAYDALLTSIGSIPAGLSRWGAVGLLGAALLFRLLPIVKTASERNRTPWHRSTAAAVMSLTVVTVGFLGLVAVFSAIVRPAYVVGRYDLAGWPLVTVAVVLTAWWATERTGRCRSAVRWWLIISMAGCGVITTAGGRMVPGDRSGALRAERIAALVGNDDLIVSVGMYRWFMAYEWDRLNFTTDVVSYPPRHDQQLCWDDVDAELADPAGLATDAAAMVDRILNELAGGRRVWLLAHGDPAGLRWPIDSLLFARLNEGGVGLDLIDEWVGLARLTVAGGE